MNEEKTKMLVKLGIYVLFLIVVICLIVISGALPKYKERNKNDIKETQKTYLEKEEDLISGKYKYTFTVDNSISFVGNFENNIRRGKKITNDATIEYIEENNNVYKILDGEKIHYVELYVGLDETIFNFEKLFDTLNRENCLIERVEDEILYTYTGVLGYNIDILANKNNIIKITAEGTHNYKLEFTY